jgi:ABC-type nitrate/sulfonate/bicarbonate transport system substrate-binding protein
MKKFFLVLTVLTIFFAGKINAAENKTVDIYVPDTLSSIPVMELDKAVIDGSNVRVHTFEDHIMSMGEFVSGKFQVLMTGFSIGLSRFRSAGDITMIATPVWGVSSLVTGNPAIKKLSDFDGKTILVPFAKSPLDLQMKAILQREKLADRIKIEYAPLQQQLPLLISGRADGICIPEPLVSKLVLEKKGYVVFTFAVKWGELNKGEKRTPQVSLFTKKAFADSNKSFISELRKAIRNRIESVRKNQGEIAGKYSKTFNLDQSVIESGLKNVLFDLTETGTEISLCRNYEKAIGNLAGIDDNFFYNNVIRSK